MLESKYIGKYEILEEIGRGGFAVVYKARNTESDRIAALKVLAPHLKWDTGFITRFQAEFETVTRLRHPNIVSVYEYGEADEQPYIALEYLSGITMKQLLEKRDGPLPLTRALHLAQQIAAALTYALRRGIVHRDIKPSNIMIDAEDRVKLTDFGIAKVAPALSRQRQVASLAHPSTCHRSRRRVRNSITAPTSIPSAWYYTRC